MGSKKTIAIFTIIVASAILYSYFFFFKVEERLPVYQPSQINPALVDPSLLSEDDHRILDFSLINQLGDTISLSDVEGSILIVDFFFTRCATICPILTSNLKLIQDRLPDGVRILSHSVTPYADSVSVLSSYADKNGADSSLWWFLTGQKDEIYKLARKSYFACLDEGDGGYQDFVHTENVVLVDTQGRLRGFYDGTREEEISQLYQDLTRLIKENSKKK
ncbi:MAG: SCO family protein [Gammaproteobacteria bacterium]|nr:SCO family protein [Gammaproteobacteria bacterium]